MVTVVQLPIYPSTHAKKGFSASQLAQFHSNLLNALAQVIVLPPAKQDTPSTRAFLSSYTTDSAHQVLEALIWENTQAVKDHDRLCQRVLVLAEKLSSFPPGLDLRTLLDLCVAFPFKTTRLRSILSAALGGTPDLPSSFATDVVPAFTQLLSPSKSSGLYGLRKTARCLTSLLRPSPPGLVRAFAHSKEFLVMLARAYDDGLTAISRSYGNIRIDASDREPDHWEKIWLDTKVDIVDAFHLIVTTMARDMSTASGAELAVEADRTLGIVFSLLDITPQSAAAGSTDMVPFLNRSLVADYQYAYELNRTLSSAFRHVSRDDARMELLESTLRSLDVERSGVDSKDPGALELILRSSGIVRGTTDKGKAKAKAPEPSQPYDADIELQMTQVLDVFPDHSPEYIRNLLTHPSFPFRGNAERVIEALLEGTAPHEDPFGDGVAQDIPVADVPMERRNAFDQEIMDLSRVHIGKKPLDGTLHRDRTEIELMKAEILRRAEMMSEDSDEEESREDKALDVIDLDDDLDAAGSGAVRVLGDGEDSGDEEVNPVKPETILELAYIRDPNLFNRDAETRRSKARANLKQQTGWMDEQIEGWRIMLERNPKKERILEKHEFSGNRNGNILTMHATANMSGGSQRGGSRGRSRGRGSGGGGERSGAEVKSNEVARERTLKERHKSDNRKRGHDKKMGKAGAVPSA